ncbi:MAG: DUF599 domain-containing protein [Methylococcaceae bacterium]
MLHNVIAFAVSVLLVLLYYLYLNWRTRRQPNFTVHAMNARVRQRWVEMIMANEKMDILAVQTLRNSVMASNFMASTAVLLIIGILNLSQNTEKLITAWQPFVLAESASNELCLLKLGLLLLDFFIAFYCFSMAIRFFNHVGYMVNLPADTVIDGFSPKQIGAYLNRAGTYYTLGTRAFFFSLPLILWFFGPYLLVLATLVLIASLYSLDRVP